MNTIRAIGCWMERTALTVEKYVLAILELVFLAIPCALLETLSFLANIDRHWKKVSEEIEEEEKIEQYNKKK